MHYALFIMVMVHDHSDKKYSAAPDAKSVSENQEYQVKITSKI